jgi:peroxiredoxin
MKKHWRFYLFILLIILLSSCSTERDVAPVRGAIAPDFTLTNLEGDSVHLNDLRGSAVFINFWHTECRYCQYEMPNIQKMHDTYTDDGLVVLGVNVGNSQQDAVDYTKRLKITFPILLDSDEAVNGIYLVTGYPTSFFIDKEGIIQSIYIGELTREEMEKLVKQVLK